MKNWQNRRKFCSKNCESGHKAGKPIGWLSRHQFSKNQSPWNKGKKDPASSIRMKLDNPMKRQEVKLKSSLSHTGKRTPDETRRKMSVAQKLVISEGRHNFYKHGRSSANKAARNNVEYKIWRSAVFQRDEWLCQTCRLRENNKLHAHHIKSWIDYPELRFDVNNGVTLCENCHKLTDSYPKNLCLKKNSK